MTAQLPAVGTKLTYQGGTSCAGGVGVKTIDVVPQVFNRINGKALWFNISLAGLYQGPVPGNPLRLSGTRAAVAGHSYRVLVAARVVLPDGHIGTATACAGADCARFPVLSLQPSFTFQARPSSEALIRNVPCILGQNGLTFNLVNGSYVVDYGGYSLCTREAKVTRRELTVCAGGQPHVGQDHLVHGFRVMHLATRDDDRAADRSHRQDRLSGPCLPHQGRGQGDGREQRASRHDAVQRCVGAVARQVRRRTGSLSPSPQPRERRSVAPPGSGSDTARRRQLGGRRRRGRCRRTP